MKQQYVPHGGQFLDRRTDIARLKWQQGEVAHLRLGSARDFVTVSNPSAMSFSFTSQPGCIVEKAGRTATRDIPAGHVGVSGPEPISWLRVDRASEIVEITATPQVRHEIADELGVTQHAQLDDLHGFSDPVIWAVSARFRAAARGWIELSDVERDTLIRQTYRRIFEALFQARGRAETPGALDRDRLNRVVDYVESHLVLEIGVDRLADIAALSPFHFLRSFRTATGMTPHAFVRGRRLERARQLIAIGMRPSVAGLRFGFTHERHFRTVFKRHHGFAPEEIARC